MGSIMDSGSLQAEIAWRTVRGEVVSADALPKPNRKYSRRVQYLQQLMRLVCADWDDEEKRIAWNIALGDLETWVQFFAREAEIYLRRE